MGLLSPLRSPAGQRLYRLTDRYRVAAILQAKEAGMSLDDIRAILTAPSPAARTAVLRRQRDELARRIADAQGALRLIEAGLDCRHGDLASCPHFQSLLAERVGHP
jgi:MerR family transcriptional regulator, copper efflux regulator